MRSDFSDITGKKYNMLTAIAPVEKDPTIKNRCIYWKCLCDCGTILNISGSHLRSGRQVSCGCVRKTKEWGDNISKSRTKPTENMAQTRLFYSYKQTAAKRGFSFDLLFEDFIVYLKVPCHYCGTVNSNALNLDTSREKRTYYYNGIDRVNNSKGYTKENCVACCRMCNTAKMNETKEDFLQWVQRVYHFNQL